MMAVSENAELLAGSRRLSALMGNICHPCLETQTLSVTQFTIDKFTMKFEQDIKNWLKSSMEIQ